MTLDEAIKHTKEVASNESTCKECANEHYQLMNWLIDLKNHKDIYSKVLDVTVSNFFALKKKENLSEYEKGCFDTYKALMDVLHTN